MIGPPGPPAPDDAHAGASEGPPSSHAALKSVRPEPLACLTKGDADDAGGGAATKHGAVVFPTPPPPRACDGVPKSLRR